MIEYIESIAWDNNWFDQSGLQLIIVDQETLDNEDLEFNEKDIKTTMEYVDLVDDITILGLNIVS